MGEFIFNDWCDSSMLLLWYSFKLNKQSFWKEVELSVCLIGWYS